MHLELMCKDCSYGNSIPRGTVQVGSVLNGYLVDLPFFGEINIQRKCYDWTDNRDRKPEFVQEDC